MKFQITKIKKTIPVWIFLASTSLYNELLLHYWITQEWSIGRVLVLALFALGFGGILGSLIGLIPSERWQKWTAVALSALIGAFWVTEYFISDTYQVFMTPNLMLSGAGGVMEDYFDLVVSLVARGFWRILLVLVPPATYAVFGKATKAGWNVQGVLAVVSIACCLLGILGTHQFTGDYDRLRKTYEFDSAVRTVGLNMAVVLEGVNSGADESAPAFVEVVQAPIAVTEPVTQEVTVEKEYPDNVIERLYFDAMAESKEKSSEDALHLYDESQTPSKENQYTGLFKGKNLILITAEAFSHKVIDPELTPTLYRMATQGIEFTEFYQPAWGTSTISGEFSNVVGLVPVAGGMCINEARQQDLFLTMGHQLQDQGYYSAAYHNHNHTYYNRHLTHPYLGYDTFIAQYNGLEGVDHMWPESDLQLIEATFPKHLDEQPFSLYYMTVSGHSSYTKQNNYQSRKNYDQVAHLSWTEPIKCYLAAQLELEYAMEALLGYLEEAGIADDTVIVISPDHYPYGLEESSAWKNYSNHLQLLMGMEEYDRHLRDENSLIIWSGCLEGMELRVDEPVYSLDILPTISNLFGVDFDSRLLVGRDVFSDTEPLVLWADFSWKTEKGFYDAIADEFHPEDDQTVSQEYIDYIHSLVANKITYSRSVQRQDYFNYLSKELGRTDGKGPDLTESAGSTGLGGSYEQHS